MIDNSWCEKQDRTNHDDQIIVVNIVNHFIVFFFRFSLFKQLPLFMKIKITIREFNFKI